MFEKCEKWKRKIINDAVEKVQVAEGIKKRGKKGKVDKDFENTVERVLNYPAPPITPVKEPASDLNYLGRLEEFICPGDTVGHV